MHSTNNRVPHHLQITAPPIDDSQDGLAISDGKTIVVTEATKSFLSAEDKRYNHEHQPCSKCDLKNRPCKHVPKGISKISSEEGRGSKSDSDTEATKISTNPRVIPTREQANDTLTVGACGGNVIPTRKPVDTENTIPFQLIDNLELPVISTDLFEQKFKDLIQNLKTSNSLDQIKEAFVCFNKNFSSEQHISIDLSSLPDNIPDLEFKRSKNTLIEDINRMIESYQNSISDKQEGVKSERPKGHFSKLRDSFKKTLHQLFKVDKRHFKEICDAINNNNLKPEELKNLISSLNDESLYNALILSIDKGNTEIIKLLVEHGANVNQHDGRGKTPLMQAIFAKLPRDIIALLIEKTTPKNLSHQCDTYVSALHYAIQVGDEFTMNKLVEKKVSLDLVNREGRTILHWAMMLSTVRIETIMTLIDKTDINTTDHWGETPLMRAIRNNFPSDIIDLLIKKTNVEYLNSQNNKGLSPLHIAVLHGNLAAVTKLLEKEFPINSTDQDGDSCLHLTIKSNSIDIETKLKIIKTLIEKGIDKNIHDELRYTALDIAQSIMAKKSRDG